MQGRIRQSDVDEVKSRVNIVDVVGQHVTLKPAGAGSLKGLCPFHDERSPSFQVRPQLGYYHCFGCGESGDAYTFLQRFEHLSFAESVERLAGRIGFELHYEEGSGADVSERSNKSRLYLANQAAAEFFVTQLASSEAAIGREFLGRRGFDAAAAQKFGVGFAPKSWDRLMKHLKGLGFTEHELITAGLLSTGEGGKVYDRFRGRLIWPIRDVSHQVLGFGARKLLDDDNGPKYLNTPETPIYRKSQVLYGMDQAQREIAKQGNVVVVEGYTDVMACHLSGITTAIATCGTAFGVEHIKILRRVLGDDSGLGQVIFTFDGDAAGQNAALKAFGDESRFVSQTYVSVAPDGLDPCDLRLTRGDGAVRALIDSKTPMFEYALKANLAAFNLDTVEGRAGGLRAGAPIVAGIRDDVIRRGYTRELARMLGLELGEVSRAVSAQVSGARSAARSKTQARGSQEVSGADWVSKKPVSQTSSPGAVGLGEMYAQTEDAIRSGTDSQSESKLTLRSLPNDPSTRLERDALQAIIVYPERAGARLVQRALECQFTSSTLAVIRDALVTCFADNPENLSAAFDLSRVKEVLPAPFATVAVELAVSEFPHNDEEGLSAYVTSVLEGLVERELLREKAELLGRLSRADSSDRDTYDRIQRALLKVENDRRELIAGRLGL